ncbi:GEVED domain-containing protein [Alloscardovia macacae]|nr:GEVED domain-containing protein [Alloscardovia macacae]
MKISMKRTLRGRTRAGIAAAAAVAVLATGGAWLAHRANAADDTVSPESPTAQLMTYDTAGTFSENRGPFNKHYEQYQDSSTGRNKSLTDINNQLFFLDWSDPDATITNLGNGGNLVANRGRNGSGAYGQGNAAPEGYDLQVGSTWTKEITPGYVVTVRVKSLQNILGEPNGLELNGQGAIYDQVKKDGGDPDAAGYRYGSKVIAYKANYNNYGAAYKRGLTMPGYSTVAGEIMPQGYRLASGDNMNIGITYDVSATYKGRTVKPTMFFTTGESAGRREVEIYKTNGKGWQLATELTDSSTGTSFSPNSDANELSNSANGLARGLYSNAGYTGDELTSKISTLTNKLLNTTFTSETVSKYQYQQRNGAQVADGLGTQTFGPVTNQEVFSTPVVYTQGATEVSAYLASTGAQAFAMGVMALDEGDAPASYGDATHAVSTGMNNDVKQPYVGSVTADIDEKDLNSTKPYWTRDGTTDDADEGTRQLMGNDVETGDNYTLHHANDKTYTLKFLANPNGNAQSYTKAWVDFNNNGKFDADEGSNTVTATSAGTYELTFSNIPQNVDTTVTKLGMRVRTALNESEIQNPTGMAWSGEVEDFQIQQTVPPRGEKKTSEGVQGATQTSTVNFTAYGQNDYDFNTNATIDESKPPVIVKADGTEVKASDLDSDGYYVVPGEGKYKVTGSGANASVEFVPEPTFVGTAKGITIRRTDSNGVTTGWGANGNPIVGGTLDLISDQTNTMDGRFIPTVTPGTVSGVDKTSTGMQGASQKQTVEFTPSVDAAKDLFKASASYPAKLVDPATGQVTDATTVDARNAAGEKIGTYTIDPSTGEVTFQPDASFTGTAQPATVSLTAPIGKDADGKDVTATATATYTPTVLGVNITPNPATSENVQGATQTGKPSFAAASDAGTVRFQGYSMIDPSTGNATTDPVTIPNVGTYTIDAATGEVTFKPVAGYVTTADNATSITVRATTTTGVTAEASYTPTVTPLAISSTPDTSEGKQGAQQTGQPKFTAPTVPNDVKLSAPAYAFEDGTTTKTVAGQGVYTIDAKTGVVTFQPEAQYVGTADPVTVKASYTLTAADGSTTTLEKTDTYTPTVTAPTIQASKETSTGLQGASQNKTVTFTKDDGTTVAPSQTYPAKLIDPATGQPTDAASVDALNEAGEKIGTYTLDSISGNVTFQPNPDFTGTAQPARVSLTTQVGVDKDGNPVTATAEGTYTPTVTPVNLSHTDDGSKDVQGVKQSGQPKFSATRDDDGKQVDFSGYTMLDPVSGNPTTDPVVVDGVGTYTIDPKTGKVEFTPVASYVTADDGSNATHIEVRATTVSGLTVDGTYTPVVTPLKAEGTPAESEGPQGARQTGTPEFTAPKPGEGTKVSDPVFSFSDGSTTVTTPGEGTYTIDPKTGVVTFTPEAGFTGKAQGVKVKATYTLTGVDGSTTPIAAEAAYTPSVTPLKAEGTPDTSEGPQGKSQNGTPKFTAPKPGEGTKVSDPVFSFSDGSTTVTTPGEGTYTIDPKTGVVTFTPEANFKGKAQGVKVKATYTLTGVDGSTTPIEATAQYTPSVYVVTSFVDENGNPISDQEKGEKPSKDIAGYVLVSTTTDEFGNVIHHYKKVVPTAVKTTPSTTLAKTGTAIVTILVVALVAVAAGVAFVVIRKRNAGDHKE